MSKSADQKTLGYAQERQYSENLSHELLTPLSIIRTEAELLLQSSSLNRSDLKHVDTIIETVNRLIRINKGLILLTKIPKGIYIDREKTDLAAIIHQQLEGLKRQLEIRKIDLKIVVKEQLELETNRTLIELLITNALKNAIIHNIAKGSITIKLKGRALIIENTGRSFKGDTSHLFERFVSGEASTSIGLGLSIMKQICEQLNYQLSYTVKGKKHRVSITF